MYRVTEISPANLRPSGIDDVYNSLLHARFGSASGIQMDADFGMHRFYINAVVGRPNHIPNRHRHISRGLVLAQFFKGRPGTRGNFRFKVKKIYKLELRIYVQ